MQTRRNLILCSSSPAGAKHGLIHFNVTAADQRHFPFFQLLKCQTFMPSQESLNQSSLLWGNRFKICGCIAPRPVSIWELINSGGIRLTSFSLLSGRNVFVSEILRTSLSGGVPGSDSSDSNPGQLKSFPTVKTWVITVMGQIYATAHQESICSTGCQGTLPTLHLMKANTTIFIIRGLEIKGLLDLSWSPGTEDIYERGWIWGGLWEWASDSLRQSWNSPSRCEPHVH